MAPETQQRFTDLQLAYAGELSCVYRAQDAALGRWVALKQVAYPEGSSAQLKRELYQRFRESALAQARLEHPNVVRLLDVYGDGDEMAIVSEYVEGRSLAQLLASRRLSEAESLDLFEPIGRGVAYAHSQRVLHRDIKPENIMIDGFGVPKVLDFGIAKLMDRASVTVPGRIMGTPGYMSPEQVRGERVDQRTDVFALGVLLYEMASGAHPWPVAAPLEAMEAVVRSPLPAGRLSVGLQQICERATAKRPDARYQSVDALMGDIARIRAGETPIEAPQLEPLVPSQLAPVGAGAPAVAAAAAPPIPVWAGPAVAGLVSAAALFAPGLAWVGLLGLACSGVWAALALSPVLERGFATGSAGVDIHSPAYRRAQPVRVVETGAGGARRHEIARTIVRIGRGPDNDIVLPDTFASGHHCQIAVYGETLVLSDLGSTNGTRIAGRRVVSEVVPVGTPISIGQTTLIVEGV